MKSFILFVSLSLSSFLSFSQVKFGSEKDSTDLTFSGTKINPYNVEYDTTGQLVITGYIDAYFAHYTDSTNASGYEKFPTEAPRNNQFGLNMIQVSAKYTSRDLRSTITLFGGDCPSSAWSPYLNYVQEANVGFRIYKRLWIDAGFFRTHIGLESIQPRENMTLSLATTTYFEPYFLSGAKLTWQQSDRLTIQLNVFNSFNQFVETNKNKAVGLSVAYAPSANTSLTFSSLMCDESIPSTSMIALQAPQRRVYNNLCFTHRTTHWFIGAEANCGIQQYSQLSDPSKSAYVFSALVAARYRITHRWSTYLRGELFNDKNEILTGPVFNENHAIVGPEIVGLTHGYEYKPIPNSYVRIEGRVLSNQDGQIFELNGNPSHLRYEVLCGMGVWF
jgi:hypothetical protein